MEPDLHVSDEFRRLERLLAGGPRPVPPATLRRRVLSGVRRELRSGRIRSLRRAAAALAAVLLVEFGLTAAAVQATNSMFLPRFHNPSVHVVAQQIRRLSPELPPEESLRRAALLQIAAEVGCPTPLSRVLAGAGT